MSHHHFLFRAVNVYLIEIITNLELYSSTPDWKETEHDDRSNTNKLFLKSERDVQQYIEMIKQT